MDKKSKIISIAAFSVVLVAGFLINGILTHSGFEGVYTATLMNRYSILGETAKTRVESSLDMGKKLYLMQSQIETLFSDVMQESPEIEHMYITDETGMILTSTRTVLNQYAIPFRYYDGDKPVSDPNKVSYSAKFLDSWFLCIPLFEGGENYAGTIYMEIPQDTVSDLAFSYIHNLLKAGLVIFVMTFVIYLVFLVILWSSKAELILTVCLVLMSQGAFSVFAMNMYRNAIADLFNKNLTLLSYSIKEAVEAPAAFTHGYANLSGINEYLSQRLNRNTDCAEICITDTDMNVVYSAVPFAEGEKKTVDRTDKSLIITPIKNSDLQEMVLVLKINNARIRVIIRDMILDSAIVVIVAIIFALIFKDFFAMLSNKEDLYLSPERMDDEQSATCLRLIKVSTFIFMFAANVTLSFVPVYIQSIYNISKKSLPSFITALPADTIISFPVSSYMLGITIAMFLTLFVLKGLDVRKRYILMSSIFVTGTILTISAYSILPLIFARFVAGFGFGGILLSTSSLVIEYTSEKTRSAGFGTNASALAAASIASIPVGGVIVNKFGYQTGFVIAVVFAALFLFFAIFFVPSEMDRMHEETLEIESSKGVSVKEFMRVLFSRHILVYIFTVNIPFQFIYWGLFSFLLPLYMNDTLHLSQSNIGLILSIFSVISLFAATAGKTADRVRNDKLLIGLGAMVCGASFLIFGSVVSGLLMFIVAMICMGIDNLFIDSIEEVYLEAGKIRGVSGENVLQSYKVLEKVLSVFVPTVTGMIISRLGFALSFFVIGGYSAIGGLLFIILGQNARWRKEAQ